MINKDLAINCFSCTRTTVVCGLVMSLFKSNCIKEVDKKINKKWALSHLNWNVTLVPHQRVVWWPGGWARWNFSVRFRHLHAFLPALPLVWRARERKRGGRWERKGETALCVQQQLTLPDHQGEERSGKKRELKSVHYLSLHAFLLPFSELFNLKMGVDIFLNKRVHG